MGTQTIRAKIQIKNNLILQLGAMRREGTLKRFGDFLTVVSKI